MKKRMILVGSVIVGLVAALGAAAFACTEFTTLTAPTQSMPATQVELRGSGKAQPTEIGKTVEIRWNGVNGPLLTATPAPEISGIAKVGLPAAPDGTYFLVAVVDGKGVARTPIEVRSTNAVAAPADLRPQESPADIAPTLNTTSNSQMIGLGLLVVGSLALLGGALVVGTRRRTVHAASPGSNEELKG